MLKKRYILLIALLSLVVVPITAAQLIGQDTIAPVAEVAADTVVRSKPVIVVRNSYAGPLGDRSALDDMMQKPRISKFYANKRAFDRFFLEGGGGLAAVMHRSLKDVVKSPALSLQTSLGDWITPEHGWRLGFAVGYSKNNTDKVKYLGVTADYMMNLTALQAFDYDTPRRLQFIGTMGLSLYQTRNDDLKKSAWDVHMGLRGQYQLSPYTYVYAEPQVRLYSQNMLQEELWEKFRPALMLQLGLGYNLSDYAQHSRQPFASDGHWLSNTYVTALCGPSVISDSHPRSWHHYIGAKAKLAVGRMFGPVWGVQLSAWGGGNKQKDIAKTMYVGLGPEAVANLHNAFGGYKPDRRFFVNALAGVGYNYSWQQKGKSHNSFSLGGGLQANVRLSNWLYFVVEPRVDIYDRRFFNSDHSISRQDVVPSLLAGLTLRNSTDFRTVLSRLRATAQPYETDGHWLDDTYVTILGGWNAIVDKHPSSWRNYRGAKGKLALGKMLGPVWGVQLSTWMGANHHPGKSKMRHVGFGPEVMVDIYSALGGYKPRRSFHINALAGVGYNHSWQANERSHNSFSLGGGLQANVRLANWADLVVEPRVDAYSSNFFNGSQSLGHCDVVPSLLAGVTLHNSTHFRAILNRVHAVFDRIRATSQPYETDGHWLCDTYITALGGLSAVANKHVSSWHNYLGAKGKLSLGKMLGPVWGVQLSAWAGVNREPGRAKTKHLGFGPEVLVDLYSAIGGYKPKRPFRINALAGIGFNHSWQAEASAHNSFSVGGGLQANVRLADCTDFVVEPRADIYSRHFFNSSQSLSHWDVVPSLLVGLRVRNGMNMRTLLSRNADYAQPTPYDDMFAEWAAGISGVTNSDFYHHPGKFLRARGYVGFGKWLSATSGVRLWMDMGSMRQTLTQSCKTAGYGLDYMWNLTNAFVGYQPDRRFYLIGSLGLTVIMKEETSRVYAGIKGAVKGLWMFNPLWGVYIEPQLRMFGQKCMESVGWHANRDFISAINMGVQLNMKGYEPGLHKVEPHAKPGRYYSIALGKTCHLNNLRNGFDYSLMLRAAYGFSYSPISSLRLGAEFSRSEVGSARYKLLTAMADYILDMSAFTFGYDPDRVVNCRFVAGAGLGADTYRADWHLVPMVRFGSQLGVRLTPAVELFGEPSIAYQINSRWSTRLDRTTIQGVVGVNCRF